MSVCNADPWNVKNNINDLKIEGSQGNCEAFEDNFTSEDNKNIRPHQPLPDSATYLQLLERKLAKVQKGSKLLDSLQQKREDCMRELLSSDGITTRSLDQVLELDTPVESGRLQRHLLPIQALTIGETVHIVKHDALEEQPEAEEQTNNQN